MYKHKNMLLLMHNKSHLLAVLPARCFTDTTQAQEAQRVISSSMAYVRGAYATPLTLEKEECRWRFQYVFDQPLMVSASQLQQKHKPSFMRKRSLVWGIVLTLSLLSFLAVLYVSMFLPRYIVFAFTLWVVTCATLLARNPRKLVTATPLPTYLAGDCTFEVKNEGIRFYTPLAEQHYKWEQISDIAGNENLTVPMHNNSIICVLPSTAVPVENVSQAVSFMRENLYSKNSYNI